MLKRAVSLTTLALLSTSLADTLTVRSTGLPAGLAGTATVGRSSVPLGGRVNLTPGTYLVTPRAVADGGKVYVAGPVRVTLKGSAAVTVAYRKLPPGSLDPFFGSGGVKDTKVRGLETPDNWQVVTSGTDLPILTATGSFQNHRAALLTLNGTLLGPVTEVTSAARPLGGGRQPSPLLRDGTGYLAGLSYLQGTLVRYTAEGQLDTGWKTTPDLGAFVRGLLRLPDGGILAYGGQSAPEVWKLRADGGTDTTFGKDGVLGLAGLDPAFKFTGIVKAGRVLADGTVRVVLTEGRALLLVDLVQGQPRVVAPSLALPFDVRFPYEVRNVLVNADGSVLAASADIPGDQSQLVRVTPAGQLDPAFRSPVVKEVTTLSGMATQRDGKVLVAYKPDRVNGSGLVIRFNANGSVDRTFGNDGRVLLKDQIYGLEIANDGKLKVVSAGLAEALTPGSAYVRITQLLTE